MIQYYVPTSSHKPISTYLHLFSKCIDICHHATFLLTITTGHVPTCIDDFSVFNLPSYIFKMPVLLTEQHFRMQAPLGEIRCYKLNITFAVWYLWLLSFTERCKYRKNQFVTNLHKLIESKMLH